MKNGFKYLIGAFVVAATTLTACGRSGNGGNNSSALGSCVYDAQGNCVTGTGSAGYVGDGNWSGRLIIQNGFQQFAQENGLCYGNCMMLSGYVQLQLQVATGGCLPGPVNFALTTFSQGYSGRQLSRRADGYVNSTNNGFLVHYTSSGMGYGFGYGFSQASLGTMQINSQFTDAAHSVLNVQIVYRGTQIASGQIYGQGNQSPPPLQNGVNMCSHAGAGGFGQGYQHNYPYQYPYTQNTSGSGQFVYGGGYYVSPFRAR